MELFPLVGAPAVPVDEPAQKRSNSLPRMAHGEDLNPDPNHWRRRGFSWEEAQMFAEYDKRVLYTMAYLKHRREMRRG